MLKDNSFYRVRSKLNIIGLNYKTKYYYGLCYILLIIISILLSFDISFLIPNNSINLIDYKELYTDTGIAFISLAGIIFTLQIFNQEIKNNYTNSVLQKILDVKFQHIIQYIYIIAITCIFILFPKTNLFSYNFSFFIPFYYLTIITVFIMFGIDLFISISKSSKLAIIKTIEKRIDDVVELVEKEYNHFDKYCKKEKVYNPPLTEYISKANSIFIGYIQCINFVMRNSLDDPVLFSNGMETYINIVKNRLEKRKNTFNYNYIPFFSDVLPIKDNDSFIEKYILEYLDEYARIAVTTNNRDILSIVQQTYYSIIVIGKDNRYINNNGLELTIKIIFIYYLKTVKRIVEYNNDNMLFETIEIFKEIFVKNGEYFNELIDISYIDEINEISNLALEKKSLMNFRNVQGLITIPMYSILNSNDDNKSYRLELLFNCLKNNLVQFTITKKLIKRKDEARTYLNYTFNIMEKYSYHNFIMNYFNNNINSSGEFIDNTKFDKDILEPFVNFMCDDLVIDSLTILDSDNRFVTGFVDYKEHIVLLVQILIKLIYSKDFEHIKIKNISLIKKCFLSIGKSYKKYSSDGMRCYEIHKFFKELFNTCQKQILDNDEICKLFFDSYYNCLTNLNENNNEHIKFSNYYKYINCICNTNLDEKYICRIIDWYISLDNEKLYTLIKIYKELNNRPFFTDRDLSYNNVEILSNIILEKIKLFLNSAKNKDVNDLISKAKFDINCSFSKKKKIELIINTIENK